MSLGFLIDHCGIRYGIDEGWTCVCGEHLSTGSGTALTRQARRDVARSEWIKHIESGRP